jgi:hypothetical protein
MDKLKGMDIQANARWVKYSPARRIIGAQLNSAAGTPLNNIKETFSETSSAALSLWVKREVIKRMNWNS